MQQAFLKEYRAKYPDQPELRPGTEEVYAAPPNYSDQVDHFQTFFNAVRSRRPVIEDATFGFRAAGPALLANYSYFEGRSIGWDPEKMKRVALKVNESI